MSINFYSQNGEVNPDLFDKTAKEIAKKFSAGNNDSKDGVKSHQFRKIFDEIKRLERKLGNNKDNWNNIFPLIKMIKSKVAYNVARQKDSKSQNYYKEFKTFINDSIDQIKNYQDFKVFCLFIEAVYGFYYEIKPKDN